MNDMDGMGLYFQLTANLPRLQSHLGTGENYLLRRIRFHLKPNSSEQLRGISATVFPSPTETLPIRRFPLRRFPLLYQNCTKTLSVDLLENSFERKADSLNC